MVEKITIRQERIGKLIKNASISLVARNEAGAAVGILLGLTDFTRSLRM